MSKNSQIVVLNETVRIQRMDQDDYISLTDIAKFKNPDDPRFVIQNWMRTRSSIEFLGIWELLNNPDFNPCLSGCHRHLLDVVIRDFAE